jgi:hypothetical protein
VWLKWQNIFLASSMPWVQTQYCKNKQDKQQQKTTSWISSPYRENCF